MTDTYPDTLPTTRKMDGPIYRDFVRDVVKLKGARNYLEVGVHNGSTLAQIECASIGVDPNFVFDRNPIGKKPMLHLYQMGSDAYFRDHDPRTVFGGPVDVAFLDGMHQFEYLLRDFINTERVCDRNSLIMMDDCIPINLEMTERQHRREQRKDKSIAGWWTGDVWKVVEILRDYRPDLRIIPVAAQPTGNVMVTNLDPTSTVLYDAYFEIMDRWTAVEMDQAIFDAYWTRNTPVSAASLLENFGLTLQVRP